METREIKFRLRIGKEIIGYERFMGDGDTCGWYYQFVGDPVWRANINKGINTISEEYYHTEKDQYTGLKSIGDIEIYEGDILEESRYGHSRGVVLFEDGKFIVDYTVGMEGGEWVKHNLGKYDLKSRLGFYRAKVIGNIYENPELLK